MGYGVYGEQHHREDPMGMDEFALAALDKPVSRKIAAKLARERLIGGGHPSAPRPPQRQHLPVAPMVPPDYMFGEEDDDMVYARDVAPRVDNSALIDLQSKLEFLKEKLELCESILTPEQANQYKQLWMIKVLEAAGDDFMSAVGRGFLQKKQAEEAAKAPPPAPALPPSDPMTIEQKAQEVHGEINPDEEAEKILEQSIRGLFGRDESPETNKGDGDTDLSSSD